MATGNNTSEKDPASITGVVDLVTTYAKQETLGPLKGAGKWLAMGTAGAAMLGIGLAILLLGILRLIQAEWDGVATGSWSWIPYVIVLVICLGLTYLAISKINRDSLNKETS